MKIEIPDKIKVVLVITERIGVPTIICLAFAYIYFMKLQKVIESLNDFRTEIKVNSEVAKNDREELKRELRRLSYRRDR